MVIARTVEGDIGILRQPRADAVAAGRGDRRDHTPRTATLWSRRSTAASCRWPTTGSRSCPSTPSCPRDRRRRGPGPARGRQVGTLDRRLRGRAPDPAGRGPPPGGREGHELVLVTSGTSAPAGLEGWADAALAGAARRSRRSCCSSSCSTASLLVVRRRVLSRHGGTFELSHRVRPDEEPGRGWLLGLGRYSGDDAGVVPHLLARPATQAVVEPRPAVLRRRRVSPRGWNAAVALPRPRGDPLRDARTGTVRAGDEPESLIGLPVLARVAPARDGLVALTASPVLAARNAVVLAFVLNGFLFATLVSADPRPARAARPRQRRPRPAAALDRGRVDPGPAVGGRAHRPVERRRGGAVGRASAAPWACCWRAWVPARWAGAGLSPSACSRYGIGTGVWDVAMNVEGAEVERGLGRTIMPRFHAGLVASAAITGAAIGVPMAARGRAVAGALRPGRRPRGRAGSSRDPLLPARRRGGGRAVVARQRLAGATHAGDRRRWCWRSPLAEGAANDWLSLALIDGYDVPHWVGVTGFVTLRLRDDGGPSHRAGRAGPVRPGARAAGARRPRPRSGRCW